MRLFRSVDHCVLGGNLLAVPSVVFHIYGTVRLRVLPSCCKTICDMRAAIGRLCCPSYAQFVRDNRVRFLVAVIKKLAFTDLRTFY